MTTKDIVKKYGNPVEDNITFERKWMTLWPVPSAIGTKIPALPKKVYCNKELVTSLEVTFKELISKDLHKEIKTWDGCFNIRKQRGSNLISVHSWGLAVDLNAAWNRLGEEVSWSPEFIEIWRSNHWVCGADWQQPRKDGMHFEWTNQ